jgi:accessory gene regulator B
MIERIAHKMAISIKRAAPEHPASIEVLAFPISAILNAVLIIVISIGISFLTNRISETATVLIGYALLRQISGGVHLKSGDFCVIVSVTGATILAQADFTQSIITTLTIASVLLAFIFSPSRIENQTRIPERFYPLLKVLSVLLIASNFLINSSVLAAAFFVQSLTLVHGRR